MMTRNVKIISGINITYQKKVKERHLVCKTSKLCETEKVQTTRRILTPIWVLVHLNVFCPHNQHIFRPEGLVQHPVTQWFVVFDDSLHSTHRLDTEDRLNICRSIGTYSLLICRSYKTQDIRAKPHQWCVLVWSQRLYKRFVLSHTALKGKSQDIKNTNTMLRK